jgi:hypothetical protein
MAGGWNCLTWPVQSATLWVSERAVVLTDTIKILFTATSVRITLFFCAVICNSQQQFLGSSARRLA